MNSPDSDDDEMTLSDLRNNMLASRRANDEERDAKTVRRQRPAELDCDDTPIEQLKLKPGWSSISHAVAGRATKTKTRTGERQRTAKQTAEGKAPLYCVCKTAYDDSQFYIGCDVCDDWFHAKCVGISEAGAKSLDTYTCPECRAAADEAEMHARRLDRQAKFRGALRRKLGFQPDDERGHTFEPKLKRQRVTAPFDRAENSAVLDA